MGVFAHRPAPIQVNYLGFPGTLGAPYMDYIIADRIVIPEERDGAFITNRSSTCRTAIRSMIRSRAIAETMPSRAACGLPENGFVFCNFNQSYKLTPEIFARWMRDPEAGARQRAVAAGGQSADLPKICGARPRPHGVARSAHRLRAHAGRWKSIWRG